MRFRVYKQLTINGTEAKKPVMVSGPITIDRWIALLFDGESGLLRETLHVKDMVMAKDGMLLTGFEPVTDKRIIAQRWWCVPEVEP